MPVHPKIDDETGIAYGPWESGWKDIKGFEEKYEINHLSQVRTKKKLLILKPNKDHRIQLYDGKGGKMHRTIYQLVLESFFPHIPRNNRTVDHIDENHFNHHIDNLWWLTLSEQTKKSLKLKPRKTGPQRSKPVEQWSLDNPSVKINVFSSAREAGIQTGIGRGNISHCALGHCHRAGGFRWKYQEVESQKDLEGEQWKTNDALKSAILQRNPTWKEKNIAKIRVSNKGRILTAQGIKTKGYIQTSHNSYRGYCGWQVHQLVWMVWGDGRPVPKAGDDLMILHDDNKEKDEEGCVSNAIEHLRLGTQSENLKSYHRAKAKKRTLSEISPETESNKRARI